MNKKAVKSQRTCGVKPRDPADRAAAVKAAVRALEKIGATFSVADVAERAGLSRATIYRSPELRALIGCKGDGVRPVDPQVHASLAARHETTKAKAREMRRRLADAEQGWDEMRERALRAEARLAAAERKIEMLSAQNARTGRSGESAALVQAVSHLTPEERRKARRQLARALHPDLFAQDSAAAALATEMLKTLNALIE